MKKDSFKTHKQLTLNILGLLLIISNPIYGQIPDYLPSDSLVGWWPFNGNANDESGNGNHGTVNGATLMTDRNGNSNATYDFDGNNDKIVINNSRTIDNTFKGLFSISIWFSSRKTSSSNFDGIIARGWTNYANYFGFQLGITPRGLGVQINSPNCGFDIFTLTSNKWENIIQVFDIVNDSITTYLNGNFHSKYSSCSNNLSTKNNSNGLLIGVEREGNLYFDGKIDDIAIWNRALSANEIKSIYYGNFNKWTGTGNVSTTSNWISSKIPSNEDSVIISSGILTINQSTTLDIMTILGGSTVKLEAPLTVRNLHIKNGTIDLNGHKLTVTGRIYQSTDSTNYYIQAGTSAAPKPRSELAIKPTTALNSTIYFNPSANRLNKLEIGNGTAAAQITLANGVKIKGGEDGGTGPGLLTVNKNAKIIIANGSSLTLESDTFNAGLSLAQPAHRSIICQGTGKFNIERDHFGARGWRLYSHPFNTDIDLQEVANDIELIGSGGTAEGFYSNTYKNASAYWYDYSKADSSSATDPAWTAFTSAKGITISGNTNKWSKNSPLLLFNPGNRRGTDAFGSPSTATYEQGKITLSYTLDSNVVHLNDGITQSITATNIPSYVPTNGLVGYWPFNGNANDESGNGNNGTVNGATLTTDRNGNSNKAYIFDTTYQYIKTNKISNNTNNELTYSFWVLPYKNDRQINEGVSGSEGFGIMSIIHPSHGSTFGNDWEHVGVGISVGKNQISVSEHTHLFIGAPLVYNCTLTNWTHVILVYRNNKPILYINGSKVKEGQSTSYKYKHPSVGNCSYYNNSGFGNAFYPNSWTQIGQFYGKIDDLIIYEKALDSSEISALYNASTNTSLSTKSKYFFITNPYTAPVKLGRIQGLTPSNVDPSYYYWKQRRNTVTNNFSPAEWQAERIFNGTALRDSNIAIPAFGTILVRLKNNNTTFTIPESAKQLTNFDYIIGGAKGTSKTGQMFLDASASDVGNNGLEIKLLVNDSQEADRVLVYNEPLQSANFTTADARKYLNQDFPNIFTLSSDGKPLALDMQDIKAELDAGKSEVAIPLAVNREANKRFPTLKWEITANTIGLDAYLRNRDNGSTKLWAVGDIKTVAFQSNASEIRNYELVFKRNISSTEDLTQNSNLSKRAPIELVVYPNPVDDQLQLKVINSNSEVPFRIYSITGVNVMTGSIKSEKTINTARLDSGVYVIDAGGVKVKFVKR